MNEELENPMTEEKDPEAAGVATEQAGQPEQGGEGLSAIPRLSEKEAFGGAEGVEALAEGDGSLNIDMIMDLPLQLVVELGRTRMLINDLLQIGQGSVIELNKQVGDPLDILVNGKLVARGEVVVVNDKFGVRITDIISPLERIKQLG